MRLIQKLIPIALFLSCWLLGTLIIAYNLSSGLADYYNADLIQPYIMARDFLSDHLSLKNWVYSASNYIFPDIPLAIIVLFISPWHLTPIVGGGLLFSGYIFGLSWLVSIGSGVSISRIVPVTAILALLVYMFLTASSPEPGSIFILFSVTLYNHTGLLLLTPIMAALFLTTFQEDGPSNRSYAVLLTLLFITSFSDMLTLFWVVIPCSIVWLISAYVSRSWIGWLKILLANTIVVVGILTDKNIRPPFPPLPVDYDAVWRVIADDVIMGSLNGDRGMIYLLVLSFVMLIHGISLVLHVLVRKHISQQQKAFLTIIGIHWTALLLPIVSGYLVYPIQFRYSYPSAIMPLAWMGLCLVVMFTYRQLAISNAFSVVCCAIAAVTLYGFTAQTIAAVNRPTGLGKCLLDNKLYAGFSDYWLSKLVIMQSDYQVSVVSMHKAGEIVLNGSNIEWLKKSVDGSAPFNPNFIITNFFDIEKISSRFGRPDQKIECSGYNIWVYSEAIRVDLSDVIKPYPGPVFVGAE